MGKMSYLPIPKGHITSKYNFILVVQKNSYPLRVHDKGGHV